jgi:murein DD-endopeptidase MepM/ murein hydrolase activator NlpD
MSRRPVEIDERLYERSEEKAAREGKTLTQVIESYLRDWVESGEPSVPPEEPTTPPEEPSAPPEEPSAPPEEPSAPPEEPAAPPGEPSVPPEEPGAPTPRPPIREEIYVVRPGDTLTKIALAMYGDASKYELIAEYNGITDPWVIQVDQELRLPFTEAPEDIPETPRAGRRFRFPLRVTETPYFRFGDLYGSGSRWAGKPHPGVDMHEEKGASVYAIGEGTVVVNRQEPTGYGHYVMIEHELTSGEKVYSLYGHLAPDDESFTSPPVSFQIRGEDVVIGKEGETGQAGVPHLHFEVKKTGQLGLYPMINEYTLHTYFYDPYTFIRDPDNCYVPV